MENDLALGSLEFLIISCIFIFFLMDGPMNGMGLLRDETTLYDKRSLLHRSSAAAAAKGSQALNPHALNLHSSLHCRHRKIKTLAS